MVHIAYLLVKFLDIFNYSDVETFICSSYESCSEGLYEVTLRRLMWCNISWFTKHSNSLGKRFSDVHVDYLKNDWVFMAYSDTTTQPQISRVMWEYLLVDTFIRFFLIVHYSTWRPISFKTPRSRSCTVNFGREPSILVCLSALCYFFVVKCPPRYFLHRSVFPRGAFDLLAFVFGMLSWFFFNK